MLHQGSHNDVGISVNRLQLGENRGVGEEAKQPAFVESHTTPKKTSPDFL